MLRWQVSTDQHRRPEAQWHANGTGGRASGWRVGRVHVAPSRNDPLHMPRAAIALYVARAVESVLMCARREPGRWRHDQPIGSVGGSGACSMLAAGRRVLYYATACCRDVRVVSVVVSNILSARVVTSPVVAVVAAVRRKELSQFDGAAR